jgi:uncharacterized protein (TIGR02145 family)
MKCGGYNPEEKFCDERGEKLYKYVEINGQAWMAENLNFNATGSRCYDDDEGKCAEYGRLYDWATAMGLEASCNSSVCNSKIQLNHQGVCPSGWHIPSGADWDALIAFIHADKGLASFTSGSSSYAGKYLKAVNGWESYSGIVNLDSYDFSALPGGYGDSDGSFVSNAGSWWSSSERSGSNAYYRYVYYSDEYVGWGIDYKSSLFSVRCLQD